MCPDAPNAEDAFAPTTNIYAEIGTAAHALLELALRLDVDPAEIAPKGVPEDMIEAVALALDYVRGYIADEPSAFVWPEERLYIIPEHGIFGTSDIVITTPAELAIIDYKHGFQIVTSWTQQGLYAVGARTKHGRRDHYRLVTVQPRARHIDGPVRELVVDNAWLDELEARARAAAEVSADPARTYRSAGAHCKYCRAAAVCPELARKVMRAAIADFTELPVVNPRPAPVSLDPGALADNLHLANVVGIWLKAVRDAAYNLIQEGIAIPGFKMVAGKKMRFWSDVGAVWYAFNIADVPEDEFAPRELVSPAGAEKLNKLRKKRGSSFVDVSEYVRTRTADPALVPESDPRPALTLGAEFNVVEDYDG